ncbi:MAG: hypothetical protein FJX25_12475 [Alphaproteobacteria bacterium]|nr:hypothetical protein [Alphaproteobacteria bacterium]
MGNSLAFMVLVAWPAAVAVIFSRLNYEKAVIWSFLLGYLLLPPVVTINLPMLPNLDKYSVTAMAALAGAVILRQNAQVPWIRPEGWVLILVLLGIFVPFVTAVTNSEPLIEGVSFRPGLSLYDGISGMVGGVLEIIPFILGYMVLSSPAAIRQWLLALVVAVLGYSLPMLIEVRLSPQLNVWIYGFFAHDFGQMMRQGGFRPMVFLSHGLWVALLASVAVIAAAVQVRESDSTLRSRNLAILLYLALVLVLCKSVAALLYAIALVPLVLLTPPRLQVRLAGLVALVVLSYPLARWLDLVPTETIGNIALDYSADRAQSLTFRFDNEKVLLERASQKLWAGWGGWTRNLIVDPTNGRISSISDGQWVVTMTTSGVLGYLASFGLLCGSVMRIALARGRSRLDGWTAGLCLIMVASLIDLIPNATLTSLTWLSAGALAGLAARGIVPATGQDPVPERMAARPRLRTIIG